MALVSALSSELGGCGKAGPELSPATDGGAGAGAGGSEGGSGGQVVADAGSVGEAGNAGNAGKAGQGGANPGSAGTENTSQAGEDGADGGACAGGGCGSGTPALCGDGITQGAEPCDDGNLKNGDGCSATCTIEPGFTCMAPAECAASNGPCVLRVPVIYHDFNAGTPADFESACGSVPRSAATLGMVQPTLDDRGLPVYAANPPSSTVTCVTSAATFGQWFADGPSSNTVADTITLFDDGKGGWVNRWGANGEQWQGFKDIANGNTVIAGETFVATDYTTCAAAGCVPCSYARPTSPYGCTGATMQSFDGNPLFFPLDNNPKARVDARSFGEIPPAYGYNFVRDTEILTLVPAPVPHDFSFTSHVVYWFKYDAAKSASLSFTGDDDVWVFINDTLAIDLGGLHTPVSGSVTVSSATAGKFGLVDGNVYRVSVFHAERARNGSSFRLALSGLYTASSVCARSGP